MFVWAAGKIAGQQFVQEADGFTVIGLRVPLRDQVHAGTAELADRITLETGVSCVAARFDRRPHWIQWIRRDDPPGRRTVFCHPAEFPFGDGGRKIFDPRQPAWRAAAKLLARMLEGWEPVAVAAQSAARLADSTGLWPAVVDGRPAFVDALDGGRPVWRAPRPFDWAKGLVAQYALARDEWAAEWLEGDR
jgi:hypothetical protein